MEIINFEETNKDPSLDPNGLEKNGIKIHQTTIHLAVFLFEVHQIFIWRNGLEFPVSYNIFRTFNDIQKINCPLLNPLMSSTDSWYWSQINWKVKNSLGIGIGRTLIFKGLRSKSCEKLNMCKNNKYMENKENYDNSQQP